MREAFPVEEEGGAEQQLPRLIEDFGHAINGNDYDGETFNLEHAFHVESDISKVRQQIAGVREKLEEINHRIEQGLAKRMARLEGRVV